MLESHHFSPSVGFLHGDEWLKL